jgi:hypothetical protein
MELVKRELDKALNKIYNWNTNKVSSARIQVKLIIEKYANNLADVRRQRELKYLLEIMY